MAKPWEKYQQAPAAPADGPWAKYGNADALAKANAAPITDLAPVQAEIDPTEGMSFGQQVAAGYGGSFVDLARGAKQAITERLAEPLNAMGNLYAALGLQGQKEGMTGGVNRSLKRQQAEIDEAARLDAPLKRSGGGMTGNVLGAVTQLVGPGVVLRNTRAAPIFLPRTVRGNVAQGAAYGASQPIETGGSRANSVFVNAGAAGVGAAIPRAIGTGYRGVKGVIEPFTSKGQERVVARTLHRSAADPSRLSRAEPSAIPGVQRTLAEETRDPGIAQLQRQFPVQLTDGAVANNTARTTAIRNTFEGADSASAAAIRGQRDQAAAQILRPAARIPFTAQDDLLRAADSIIAKHPTKPAVLQAMTALKEEIPKIGTVADAHGTRQYIGQLMGGQVEGKTFGKLAKSELTTMRGLLDRGMSRDFPDWGRFLTEYKGESKRATQALAGKKLLEAGRQTVNADSGQRTLGMEAVSKLANNPDALVAAKGFKGAQAQGTLTQPQFGLLNALSDDMSRVQWAQEAGRGVGSPTAQNMATQNALTQITGGGRLAQMLGNSQLANRIITPIEKTYGLFGVPDRLQTVLVDALSNPARARAILDSMQGADRRIVENALVRAGGRTGAVVPAFAE